jgi:hypothetical protein
MASPAFVVLPRCARDGRRWQIMLSRGALTYKISLCHAVSVVRKMVYLEAEQDRVVKLLAREMKTSETEVVRRAITAYRDADAGKLAADKRRLREDVEAHPEGWADDPAEWFRG